MNELTHLAKKQSNIMARDIDQKIEEERKSGEDEAGN